MRLNGTSLTIAEEILRWYLGAGAYEKEIEDIHNLGLKTAIIWTLAL
jgi:hypothetical protein